MLPNEIQDLLDKYGPVQVLRHEIDVPQGEFGIGVEPLLGACVVVKNGEGDFVLVRHSYFLPGVGGPDVWDIPCGRMEGGESLEETGVREALEETGLCVRITGLRSVSQTVHRAPNGETRTQHWVAVFYGEAVSGTLSSESPEILEVKTFERLPENFAGDLGKYYEDLR